MNQLKSYTDVTLFYKDNKAFLLKRELDNNVIIGICSSLIANNSSCKYCVFLNVYENNILVISVLKTISKAVFSGIDFNNESLKLVLDYFLTNKIELSGIIGDKDLVTRFSELYPKNVSQNKSLLVHELKQLSEINFSEGELIVAELSDLEWITDWSVQFQLDAQNFPLHSRECLLKSNALRIQNGDIFKWVHQNQTLSIAAIVRKTENIGIIGLVFTPKELRGFGYASALVWNLSQYILDRGYIKCGLFTDAANPTSNKIYYNIGYRSTNELLDIEFE